MPIEEHLPYASFKTKMEFIIGGQRMFSWFGKGRFLWLVSVLRLYLLRDPKMPILFDLEVTRSKRYRISKSTVKMSVIVLFICMKVETDLTSNGEGLNE